MSARQRKAGSAPSRSRTRPSPAAPDPAPRSLVAEVAPLQLGRPGLDVKANGQRFLVAAGVPGDRLRIVPQRRTVEVSQLDPSSGAPDSADRGVGVQMAEVVRIAEPSAQREDAPCPVVRQCGGCALQEMAYSAQLEAKQAALRQSIASLGTTRTEVDPIAGSSQPFGYRTKLLMVSGGQAGKLRFGFYRRGSTDLVPAEGCTVQHPLTLSTLAMLRQVLDAAAVAPTTTRGKSGWLHAVGLRASPHKGLVEVTLVGRTPRVPGGDPLIARIARLPGVHGVHLCVTPQRSSYPLGEDIRRLAGARRLPVVLGGATLMLSPGTFHQTCAEGAEQLVRLVLAALPERMRCLADLYGGAGVFSRLALGRYKRALVAESSASAIADLRHFLKHHKAPISAIAGRVEQTIGRVAAERPDVVLLDPPRKGCHPRVVDALGELRPRRIVYVSCAVETLVADGQRLIRQGYHLGRVSGVDMFPHTTHLEIVAQFDREQAQRTG